MKTAVEWLVDELLHLDNEFDMKLIDKNEYQARRKQVIEQAKEMEKEQIMTAFTQGDIFGADFFDRVNITAEEYYNETFKSEE